MRKTSQTGFVRLASILALSMFLAASAFAQYKICIDPGHGGTDSGAVGNGLYEDTVNLDTGLKFKAWMDKDTADTAGGGSWSVYMTRTTDVDVSLSARCTYANSNSVNRFMSIHSNAAADSSANGIETYCYGSGSSTSFDLRNKVYEEAILMWPLTQRGTKTASYYVLVNTNMPAELHEMAFISNSGDAAYLGSSTQRDNHAKSELFAIQRHYGYAKYTPVTGVSIIVDNTSADFSASTNWSTSTSTPGYYGTDYRARATASTSDPATWNFNLTAAGTYKVYVWYTAGTNRAAAAPYIVYYSGGSQTVNVNQQTNGGTWVYLGQWSFNSGANMVKLSCWTTLGYYVIADAVKITNQ